MKCVLEDNSVKQKMPVCFLKTVILLSVTHVFAFPKAVNGKQSESRAADIIKNWIRTRYTIEFFGAWEMIHNPNFKVVEFDHFRMQAGLPSFVMSVSEWIEKTNAIGISVKKMVLRDHRCKLLKRRMIGRNGGRWSKSGDSRVRVREEMVIQNRAVRAMENNLFGVKKIMEFAFSYRYISYICSIVFLTMIAVYNY